MKEKELVEKLETIEFEEFFVMPTLIYRVIGRDPLGMTKVTGPKKLLIKMYSVIFLVYYVTLFIFQFSNVHSLMSSKTTFLLGLASGSCESFCVSGLLKELLFFIRKKTMLNVIDELKAMFPTSREIQQEYKAREILEKTNFRLKALIAACHGFVISWSFYPIMKGALLYVILGPPFRKELAFFVRYTYDPFKNNAYFLITTLGESIGGIMAGTFFLAVDLILLAIIHNCCMHLDYIIMKIENFIPTGRDVEDNAFLDPLVELHIKILKLSNTINDAFDLTILVNFFISTIAICFISFVILFGDPEQTVKGVVFLLACLLQIWIICFMGQMLIDSSEGVGNAIYNHSWFSGSINYRRKIGIILVRAQKAATLKPPTMNPSSNLLFMEVMTTTYRFFCVLNTMFDDMV